MRRYVEVDLAEARFFNQLMEDYLQDIPPAWKAPLVTIFMQQPQYFGWVAKFDEEGEMYRTGRRVQEYDEEMQTNESVFHLERQMPECRVVLVIEEGMDDPRAYLEYRGLSMTQLVDWPLRTPDEMGRLCRNKRHFSVVVLLAYQDKPTWENEMIPVLDQCDSVIVAQIWLKHLLQHVVVNPATIMMVHFNRIVVMSEDPMEHLEMINKLAHTLYSVANAHVDMERTKILAPEVQIDRFVLRAEGIRIAPSFRELVNRASRGLELQFMEVMLHNVASVSIFLKDLGQVARW
jgi:hypothetical protein